jgi:hypothetical protein
MKKLLLFLIFLNSLLTVFSQNIDSIILGDWGLFADEDFILTNDNVYVEIFFEPDTLTIDNRIIGISPPIRYKIQNDSLYTESISKRDSVFRFQYQLSIIDSDNVIFKNETKKYLLFRIDSSDFTISNWLNEHSKIFDLRFEKELYDSISILIDNKYESQIRQRELKKRIETNKIKRDDAIDMINSILTDDNYKDQFDFYLKLKKELEKEN